MSVKQVAAHKLEFPVLWMVLWLKQGLPFASLVSMANTLSIQDHVNLAPRATTVITRMCYKVNQLLRSALLSLDAKEVTQHSLSAVRDISHQPSQEDVKCVTLDNIVEVV